MIVTVAPRSKKEVDREIRILHERTKELLKSKKAARDFLIKHGFIKKTGGLTRRYGGK